MTSRERLLASLRGQRVDRTPVNFYEIGGFAVDPADPDPFNIYHDPSWQPLLELAETQTDLIRMCSPRVRRCHPELHASIWRTEQWEEGASRFTRVTIEIGQRTLTQLQRRDQGIDTVWTLEHLLKDREDLRAFLGIPDESFDGVVDITNLLEAEARLGDRGLVMVDSPDPLCQAAGLFSMEDYTVIAFSEPDAFHALLRKLGRPLYAQTQAVARDFPGRLWRIYGPEYASPPFLPAELFDQYVGDYLKPMIAAIHAGGGFVRVHCHGRVRAILPRLVAWGVDATDPLEPPPQGDITLAEARAQVGDALTIFGNIEITDLENMPPAQFEKVVARTLAEGTTGPGRGFVLMPSAAPYGSTITPTTLANYQTMVRLVHGR